MIENFGSVPIPVGFVFLIAGILMLIFPPKKINYLYGYRTSSSMKNMERWNFAQKLSAKLMVLFGFLLLLTGLLGYLFAFRDGLLNTVGVIETVLFAILLFVKTEYELNKKFGKNL